MEPTETKQADNYYWAEMLDALEVLENNPSFQKLILQGYFHDKAVNSTSLLSDKENRSNLLEELVSISNLQYFFMMVKNLGGAARQDAEAGEFPEEE